MSLPTCCSSAQPESEPHASSQPDQPSRERLPVLVGRSASQLARGPLVTVSGVKLKNAVRSAAHLEQARGAQPAVERVAAEVAADHLTLRTW